MASEKLTKNKICESAVSLYVEDPSLFSITSLAKELSVPRTVVYKIFSTKNAVLRFYYQDCFGHYLKQVEELEDYQEFSLEEKLSHLVYTHFELFQQEKEFVEDTFKDLIANASAKSKFQEMLETRINTFLSESQGDASLVKGAFISQLLVMELIHLMGFWLQDDSDDAEQTMELTDKMISFASELLSSQILSRGIDLGRVLWGQNLIRLPPEGLNLLVKALIGRKT